MRFPLVALFLFAFAIQSVSQSTIYVRNNTWQDFDVSINQSGTLTVDGAEWEAGDDVARGWLETTGQEVLTVNRTNTAVPEGDTAYYDVNLTGEFNTLAIKLRVIGVSGGTTMDFTIDGDLFSIPFFNDNEFHEVQTSLAGKDVTLKFKADNGDGDMDRDVRFVIHDLPIYEIDQADFENPNVMNAMFYNIQMLPFGVVGMGQASERAALLPAQLSEFQDVVMFAEVFDTSPRENDLAPAMEAAGFIHRTTILNDPGLIPFPWNGGVMIFSKWPIEADEEIDFEDCGQASQDCLANKGIKYAKVNKLGKRYHIFGTHMDAGGGADDLFARRSQMAEMRDFIADLNIPDGEPVILGGDFNLDPNDIEYMDFKDTMNPYIPQHIGFYESTFSDQFGRIIDHAWGDRAHLVATSSTNEVITPRSIEPELWESSEFSDHRSVLGRFVYPDVKKQGGDTLVCPGENLTLSVETDHAVTYQWSKDGTELSGETGSELNLSDAQEIESGNYTCLVGYDVEYGQWGDTLTEVFYPNGPDIVEARLTYDFGEIVIDQVLCEVGIDEYENGFIQLHPNPATDKLFVSLAESNQDGLLTIYTASGQLVYTQSLQNSNLALDVSEYESGLYLIEFASEKGQFHQRFVVY